MRSKLSWIPFILLLPAACFLKLATSLMPDGLFGLNALQLDYAYLGCVALMFLFALFFCLIDRRIAAYYIPHRNIFAGLIALVSALLLAADGAGVLIRVFSAGENDVLTIIGAVLSLINAIVFIALGLGHMVRRGDEKKLSLVYALPAVMFAVRLILSFVSFTTISIRLADVSRLVCYVFTLMFFFYFAVVLSMTKTKNAVKMCMIFGFPAVAALIPYGVYRLMFGFDTQMMLQNAEPAELLLFGVYIFAILIEISMFVTDKDSVEPVLEEEEQPDLSEKKVEGFIANNITEDENDAASDDTFISLSDTEGFLYQETDNAANADEDETLKNDVEGYLTEIYDEDSPDPEDNRPKNYEDQLDNVDKLILEIAEKSD